MDLFDLCATVKLEKKSDLCLFNFIVKRIIFMMCFRELYIVIVSHYMSSFIQSLCRLLYSHYMSSFIQHVHKTTLKRTQNTLTVLYDF